MDINYLLLLQNFRNEIGDALTHFMEQISYLAISFWPFAIFCIVYWAVNKKTGTWMLLNFAGANLLNGFLKLTACVYRPWIKDARIIPAGDAITTATGYSFPSGHSTNAAVYYGSGAASIWKNKKWRFISVLLILLVFLTMFSRNYLGVHTPQDVIVGCFSTFLLIFINTYLYKWIEADVKNRDITFVIIGFTVIVALVVYITFKQYPMDYVDGALLVDPSKMKPDTFEAIGAALGFLIGWFIEKRFIKFEIGKDKKKLIIITIIALIPMYFWNQYFINASMNFIGKSAAKFLMRFVEYIYIFIIVPLIIKSQTSIKQ